MSVSSYGDDTKSSGVVKIIKDLDESIEGKDVLIVEDIIDSGRTLSYLIEVLKQRNPASIRLTADRSKIKADKNDLAYVKIEVLDKDGRVIPDCEIPLEIKSGGKGSVIASGNGSADDMRSFRSLTPKTFRGKAIVIVQPDTQEGNIHLTVSAKGLPEANISIETYE